MKFAVLSDIHAYASTVYSGVDVDGVNKRLRIILNEMERAAKVLKDEGGSTMVLAGDLFHTRGSIDPEVLNPLRETFEKILAMDIDIYAIPGNHDLKSSDTQQLSSQVENLAQVSIAGGEFKIFNEVGHCIVDGVPLGFVPWRNRLEGLHADLAKLAAEPDHDKMHVFIHAGIDGVLSGMPAHGLTSADLAKYGFACVYAGHYHHHHNFAPDAVVSIGATTHQNWGDVGTKAGFLIVDAGNIVSIKRHDSQAPKFVDVSGMNQVDLELACDGNYVRFRGPTMTQQEINDLRDQFKNWGALGVSIEVPKATVATRPGTASASGKTLDQSVDSYIDGLTTIPTNIDKTEVKRRAQEVLDLSRSVTEEA